MVRPDDLIRSELFGLEQHAESLAAAQPVTTGTGTCRHLARRLKDNGQVLFGAHRNIANAVREEHAITPADEWLLDNFYVAQEQIRQVRRDLPPGFCRGLPKLAAGPLKGYPRVFGLAWALVAHTDSRLDRQTLVRFVGAYQRSAGWMYRAGLEWILGFRLRGTTLVIDPCVPTSWPRFDIAFRYRSARYAIAVLNPNGVSRGVSSVSVDGKAFLTGGAGIPLSDDGAQHVVEVVLG